MDEIIIHNQREMDAVPIDYTGRIIIEGENIAVKRNRVVKLRGKSTAYLYDNAIAELYDNASAYLFNASRVLLYDKSNAYLHDNARAYLYSNAFAELYNNTIAELYDKTNVRLHNMSIAYLRDKSNAYLYNNAIAYLCNNTKAYLQDNTKAYLNDAATAELYGNATAVMYDITTAELYGNSQVVDESESHNITLHGNARVVYLPRNIDEYLDYFGIKHTKDMATLYKAVRKTDDGKYVSNHNATFEYPIGKYKTEECNTDATQSCSCGIHIAPLPRLE
jgi:hypothetical protein